MKTLRAALQSCITPMGVIAASGIFLLLKERAFLSFFFGHLFLFTPHSFLACLSGIGDIVFVMILFLGFVYYGSLILRALDLSSILSGAENILVSAVIGEAMTAFLIMTMGFFSCYQWRWFVLVYIVLTWGAFNLRSQVENFIKRAKVFAFERVDFFSAGCLFILSIPLFRAVLSSGAPPTNWDCLAYHLACPKIFYRHRELLRLPWSINAHFPLNTEMIYLLCLVLRNDLAAQWVNFAHALLLVAALWALARRYFSSQVAGMAVAIFAAQPAFSYVTGNAMVDCNLALICLLAMAVFLGDAEPAVNKSRGFLCGALAGIAMSVKITGTWLVAVLFFLRLWRVICKKENWPSMAMFLFGVFLCGTPWYLKNFIWTGNPIWPFLGRVFGANSADLAAWNRISASVTEGVGKNLFNFALLPLWLIVKPHLFHHWPVFSILPFGILMILRFLRKKPFLEMEKTWMSLVALWALCWFWVYQDWRYFLPAMALMAVLESFWALENWRLGRWRLVSVLTLALAVSPVLEISANNESYAFFHLKPQQSHLSSRQRYLELSLGPPFMVEEIANKILPPKAKILMYRDVRGYYLDRDYAWGDPLNPGVVDFLSVRSSADLLSRLRAQGFGYILYDPWIGHYQGYPGYYQRADQLMMGVLARSQKLVSIGGVSIDRLPARGEGGLSLNPPANN